LASWLSAHIPTGIITRRNILKPSSSGFMR